MPSFSFSGGVEVLGFISPTDTNDTYPVIDPLYGIDGLRNVNTITELNSITNQRRRPGMVVGVNDGSIYYKLNSPPWNGSLSDWSIFQSGGGGGTFTGGTISGDTIFTQGVTATTLNVNGVSITGDTYTTGFTYDNVNTFNIYDNLNNVLSSSITVLSATTISGGTFYGDGSNLTNTPDKYITDLSFNNSNYNLTVTRNDLWSDTVSLSILSSDMTITGGTYNSGSGVATFTNNSGGTFNVSGFLVGYTDHYVTGYTYDDSNTFNIYDNSGNTFSASINTMTGLTVNGTLSATTYLNLPVTTDTNFANTDLTFTGYRVHDLDGYGVYLSTDGTSYSEGYLGIDTSSVSLGMLTPSGSSIIYQTVNPTTPGIIEYSAGEEIRKHTITESIFYVYQDRNFVIRDDNDNHDFLTVDGLQDEVNIKGNFNVSGNTIMSGSSQNVLTIIGSGNTSSPPIFSVQGSNGELFSVNDSLIGSLFSVNDISGIPIFEVFSDNTILMGSYLAPSLNTTVRVLPPVGTTNVYSLPLSAHTGAWFEYTVKSTTGARSGQIMSIFSGTTVNITETTTTSIGVTTPITFNMISNGTNATLRVSVISGTWEVRVIIRSI